ncbi:MAG TPA: PKD domain-containing protein [Candidatus Barnesiella merdipullorum]|nr:PKD domain-containing protein [Candidatus Barnesiella merdipullorum]
MKALKNIGLTVVLLASLSACVENDPTYNVYPSDDVAFTYRVTNEGYELDYLVGSTIQFTNTSALSGACTWDFGDGETSTEPNPTHTYNLPGQYEVKLTVGGEFTTRPLLINDIKPTIVAKTENDAVCVINNVEVTLEVTLRNPAASAQPEYTWVLPEGTTLVDHPEITNNTYVGENPGRLTFKNIGSQTITLKTMLGGRALQDVKANVQVGTPNASKTLYYAVKSGNIMAYKLDFTVPEGSSNSPFDLGVKSGAHPLNLLFHNDLLYVLDCGTQFTYINDTENNRGDGKITAVAKDGSSMETVLSNVGNTAFNDPFYGWIDSEMLYFADRNTGIRRIGVNERNLALSTSDAKFDYFVMNNRLEYYGNPWQYGAMNACFAKVDGLWYWGKTYGGGGIFRFADSDISTVDISRGSNPPYAVIFPDEFVKSFVIDTNNQILYAIIRDKGLFAVPMADISANDASKANTKADNKYLVASFKADSEGSVGEYIDVCQMVLDNSDGSVYFGLRAEEGSAEPSGIKRWNPATRQLETIVSGVNPYGIALNDNLSSLF